MNDACVNPTRPYALPKKHMIMTFQSINPYNNQLIEEFDSHTPQEIAAKLEKADNTFASWRKTDFASRSILLKKAAETLRAKKASYAQTITLEMGKPIKESVAEIEKCAWACDYYADHAAHFLRDEIKETDATHSYVKYQPLGLILAIMPWNFPFWQTFRFAAPALMAGNVGMLKHAANVTRCALLIEEVFTSSGFPKGAFQSIIIHPKDVSGLIDNPLVKAVTLTGSEHAGISVATQAGKNIKKTVLELGGSNAFVVLADADLEQAATVGVTARMQNAGQSCIAAKRFIVIESVAAQFLALFKEKMSPLRTGDPLESTTQMGPLARVDLAEKLEDQVNRSVAQGARLIVGGQRTDAHYTPTILTDVKPGMPAFDEELFGPVAAFTVAKDEDEALALANQTSFGLGASVFTSDSSRARRFIDEIEDGAVFVNALVKSDPRLPFGGTKRSGYGRELSEHGIREFVNAKTVYIKDL